MYVCGVPIYSVCHNNITEILPGNQTYKLNYDNGLQKSRPNFSGLVVHAVH